MLKHIVLKSKVCLKAFGEKTEWPNLKIFFKIKENEVFFWKLKKRDMFKDIFWKKIVMFFFENQKNIFKKRKTLYWISYYPPLHLSPTWLADGLPPWPQPLCRSGDASGASGSEASWRAPEPWEDKVAILGAFFCFFFCFFFVGVLVVFLSFFIPGFGVFCLGCFRMFEGSFWKALFWGFFWWYLLGFLAFLFFGGICWGVLGVFFSWRWLRLFWRFWAGVLSFLGVL